MPYFVSLLCANLLQAVGVILNVKWVAIHAVEESPVCTVQGFVKQAGNVGTAVWSFFIAVCVFGLMFLRAPSSQLVNRCAFALGWFVVVFVVAIGPLAIQLSGRGVYFGPSGYWCWITDAYPAEQVFLEYFWEFLSAGLSLILYLGILLRVRGNLVRSDKGWHLRFVPSSERWQLAIKRDWMDSSMMGLAAVTYVLLLVPVAIARFIEFGGGKIPFGATIFTDTLFNLQGIANAILLFSTRRLIPDTAALIAPAPRKVVSMSSSEAVGITPFTLSAPQSDVSYTSRRSGRTASLTSIDSQTPLNNV
ncbi:hypothetical protein BDY19DRAFT_984970 [Irpex rosettiformis]|uniref:Uncharacterized protein n=1 Tax=Irpex rosettiformis TaxID=378272 RepID=A0ACB8U567_9APHY|nr:hypothetical protein BDY19DRAFT_984970 [Irpex rosettiformis]